MKKVANFNEKERQELFSESAALKGMSPAAIEKDFWICWMLMKLFEDNQLKKLLRFKGGTSLSKCFNIIDRFSEDIDLVLDWSVLTDEDPYADRSRTKQDRFNSHLNELAVEYIENELIPIFNDLIKPRCLAEIDILDKHTVNIKYPNIFPYDYLRPEIRLEIGPMSEMEPYEEYSIKSYAAESFPKIFKKDSATVLSIIPEKTFWEKVTILHAESYRNDPKHRYSRHYYDVYKMIGTKIEDDSITNLSLLEQVVRFKKKFFYSASAKYDLAKPGTINLVPDDPVIDKLSRDYEQMREMIFGEYPDFNLIINTIKEFQEKLNSLK